MGGLKLLAFAAALWAVAIVPSACAQEPPGFGLMLNDDGDLSFTSMDPQGSVVNLRAMIDSLAGTPVKTLMYSVGAGSDVLYYPTKVASVWGWRKTKYDTDKRWAPRMAKIKAGMAPGVDPIRVVGERAKQLDMFFVPSYRMNDSHFMSDPFEYPLTGEFWICNHAKLTIGESPIPARAGYGNLLDFSHKEVREFRLSVIFEVIDRYQDIMDGIELDFNRVQILFPLGKAKERAHLVTDLVAKVRTRLREVGTKHGRDYYLFVRVPPALKNCHWAGLQVEEWMKKGLVDVVIPSQLMTLAHDMPIDEFVAVAQQTGCKVYPSIYPRTSWTWPFTHDHSVRSYAGPASRAASPELIRGVASTCRHMGASGFQLYNFNLPTTDQHYRVMRDLASPAALTRMNKVYAITPAYYLDHEDSYQYRKQIPVDLVLGETTSLTLSVDELLGTLNPDYCALRLGLVGIEPACKMLVKINGNRLLAGTVRKWLVAISGSRPKRQRAHPKPPAFYLQLPVTFNSRSGN